MQEKTRPKVWCEAKEDLARGSALGEPYQNVIIGTDPRDGMTPETAKSYQAIVNVSDSEGAYFHPAYPGQAMHWIPLNEMGYWGYAAWFKIIKVLEHHHNLGHKIYLHCAAGAYRSPTAAMFWILYRDVSWRECLKILWPGRDELLKDPQHVAWKKSFPFRNGNVRPGIWEFLWRMQQAPKTHSLSAILSYVYPDSYHKYLEYTPEVRSYNLLEKKSWHRFWKTPKDKIRYKYKDISQYLRGYYYEPLVPVRNPYMSPVGRQQVMVHKGFLYWLNFDPKGPVRFRKVWRWLWRV